MSLEKPFIRSFGRIKSRKLSDHKKDLYDNLLPKYEFNKQETEFLAGKKLILEIGFGFGDFTFELAKNNADSHIIAGETHVNGIVNLLAKLEQNPLKNIRIFKSDIRILLNELNDKIFDQIYVLFPDPWPKAKHYKRRLINHDFIDLLSKKIKNSGKLIITTDHDSYKEWIMNIMISRNDFEWNANKQADWQTFPPNWTYTKYQKKAEKENRISVYLEFANIPQI